MGIATKLQLLSHALVLRLILCFMCNMARLPTHNEFIQIALHYLTWLPVQDQKSQKYTLPLPSIPHPKPQIQHEILSYP